MTLLNTELRVVINYKLCTFCQRRTVVVYSLSKEDPQKSKSLLLNTVVIFKPSSCMREVHQLEQLIGICVTHTSTGEVSPEVMRSLVLNDTSLIREMPKCGFMILFFT